ncbi:MAG: hypothetical protein ACE5LV_10450, partial [Candidatus Aminicenantales bacterium]
MRKKAVSRFFVFSLLGLFMGLLSGCRPQAKDRLFRSAWPEGITRPWAGPEFWANRLQDWRIANGRLECLQGSAEKPLRTVHILTRRLSRRPEGFCLRVVCGLIDGVFEEDDRVPPDAGAGFLVGAGPDLDYRAAALVHHSPGPGGGILALVDGKGRAVFRDMTREGFPVLAASPPPPGGLPEKVSVHLSAKKENRTYRLILRIRDSKNGRVSSRAVLEPADPARLRGSIALVSHPGLQASEQENGASKDAGRRASPRAGARFWFQNLEMRGRKLDAHEDRLCGPVLAVQYTLSRGILKLTAQMMPVGPEDPDRVRLEVQTGGDWKEMATSRIELSGYIARFRIANWDATRDVPFRVVYA